MRDEETIRFLPGIATFVIGAGLEISNYKNELLGWSLIVVGIVFLLLPAISWIGRIRVKVSLAPEPSAGDTQKPPQPEAPQPLPKERPSIGLSAEEIQRRREGEILRIERLLKPLPSSHIVLLQALSAGPQKVSYDSQAKDSLVQLKLIRYVGSVDAQHGLFEATSEQALAEYFRRKRAKELPGLLKGLSLQEQKFMSLFLLGDPLQELVDPNTGLISNAIYSAHSALEQKKLILLRRRQTHRETFALADDVIPLLLEHVGKEPLRTEIELDLRKVAAPKSSGGGVRGSTRRPL